MDNLRMPHVIPPLEVTETFDIKIERRVLQRQTVRVTVPVSDPSHRMTAREIAISQALSKGEWIDEVGQCYCDKITQVDRL